VPVTTFAFLVVFRVLIKLFFWMAMTHSLLDEFFSSRLRRYILQGACQTLEGFVEIIYC
jgi:hypothetical protein